MLDQIAPSIAGFLLTTVLGGFLGYYFPRIDLIQHRQVGIFNLKKGNQNMPAFKR